MDSRMKQQKESGLLRRTLAFMLAAVLTAATTAALPAGISLAAGRTAGIHVISPGELESYIGTTRTVTYGGQKWYVVGYDGTGVLEGQGRGKVTLLLKDPVIQAAYSSQETDNSRNRNELCAYKGSLVYKALETDYLDKLTRAEAGAAFLVKMNTLRNDPMNVAVYERLRGLYVGGEECTVKVFLLSAYEASCIGPEQKNCGKEWWLCTPSANGIGVMYVDQQGIAQNGAKSDSRYLRPSVMLNLSSIAFITLKGNDTALVLYDEDLSVSNPVFINKSLTNRSYTCVYDGVVNASDRNDYSGYGMAVTTTTSQTYSPGAAGLSSADLKLYETANDRSFAFNIPQDLYTKRYGTDYFVFVSPLAYPLDDHCYALGSRFVCMKQPQGGQDVTGGGDDTDVPDAELTSLEYDEPDKAYVDESWKSYTGTDGKGITALLCAGSSDNIQGTAVVRTDEKGNAVLLKLLSGNSSGELTISGVSYRGQYYTITSIEKAACKNQTEIKSLVLGDGVRTVGKQAFAGCKKLTKATMPGGVELKQAAVKGCRKLKNVTFKGSPAEFKVGANVFTKTGKSLTINNSAGINDDAKKAVLGQNGKAVFR